MALVRLQKVMAEAGLGSRRACEEMIQDGRARVNGQVRAELPVLVDPDQDEILIDGERIRRQPKVYYLVNKPAGVFCTSRDPRGRPRAIDLVPDCPQRLYPVGRLDADSTGLLILTNDGELAERLAHPRYGVEKTYVAEIHGRLSPEDVTRLKRGVWLAEGRTGPARIKILRKGHERSLLEIAIHEGKNRQVRRMLAQLGHPVRKLTRTGIGPLGIRGLKPGNYRPLSREEVRKLRFAHQRTREARGPKTSRRSGSA